MTECRDNADHVAVERAFAFAKQKYGPVIILMLSLTLLAGMRCVPYFAIRKFGSGCIDNVIGITYMVHSIVNVIYFMVWMYCKKQFVWEIDREKQNTIWLGIMLGFLVCILGNLHDGESTAKRVIDELVTGRAEKFAATFDERITLLENAPADQILYVRRLPESELLKLDDISKYMDNWQNVSWERYYGISTVVGFEKE